MTPESKPPVPQSISFFDSIGDLNVVMTPVSLRRIFLLLTRAHFSTADHYGPAKEKMQNYIWSQDPKTCKLFIELDYIYDPAKKDQRPAIFVGCGDIEYRSIATDNYKGNTEDNAGTVYAENGLTTVIIRHVAESADDALQLGDMSLAFFKGIRPLMQRNAKFKTYDLVKHMSSKPFERAGTQSDQQFICDIIINLAFVSQWTSTLEGHRLKTLRMTPTLSVPSLLNLK